MRIIAAAISGLLVGIAIGYFIPRTNRFTYIVTPDPRVQGSAFVLVIDNATGELVRTIGRKDVFGKLEE